MKRALWAGFLACVLVFSMGWHLFAVVELAYWGLSQYRGWWEIPKPLQLSEVGTGRIIVDCVSGCGDGNRNTGTPRVAIQSTVTDCTDGDICYYDYTPIRMSTSGRLMVRTDTELWPRKDHPMAIELVRGQGRH